MFTQEQAGTVMGGTLYGTGGDKIGYKVREHSLAKIPLMLVVGRREAENRTVSLRRLGSNEQQALALDDALDRLKVEAAAPTAR